MRRRGEGEGAEAECVNTRADVMPTERQVSWEEFLAELATLRREQPVEEIIVHHTETPTAAQFRGIETVAAVRHFHTRERGWSETGYHVMIGPGGEIFLCRPMTQEGAHCKGHNTHSIGVAYIANFDEEDPAEYAGLAVGQRVVKALLERFGLGVEAIRFHREFAHKTCPGKKMRLGTYRAEVEREQTGGS